MYEVHFGLSEAPFSITPDLRYLFMSEKHREGLAHLLYGIQGYGGFILLTGEVGTGKTTLCRCLLQQMPEDCVVAFVINPRLTVPELLSTICDEFHIDYPRDNKSVKVFVDLINAYLLDAYAAGKRAVLIIDEAQNLSRAVLEQIRLLTNLETAERKLLQIILLGQPELRKKLARPGLVQLSQRIIARYHLGPLTRREVHAYVNHRLAVAGSRQELFSSSALNEVFRCSGGVPRLVNLVCDRALLGAYSRDERKVDRRTVLRAAKEVLGEKPHRAQYLQGSVRRFAVGVLCALVLSSVVAYYGFGAFSFLSRTTDSVEHRPVEVVEQEGQKPAPSSPTTESQTSLAPVQPGALVESLLPIPLELAPLPAQPAVEPAGSRKGVEVPGSARPAQGAMSKLVELARSQGGEAARKALFSAWGATFEPPADMCQQASAQALRCYSGQGGLIELRQWNRPAVLKLFDETGAELFAMLTGLEESTAVFDMGGESVAVRVEDLVALWRGEYSLLWPVPPGYQGRLRVGDQGPMVAWLELQIAGARGEPVASTTSEVFTEALKNKVQSFQLANALYPDGLVGPQTVNRLLMSLHTDAPVLRPLKKDF